MATSVVESKYKGIASRFAHEGHLVIPDGTTLAGNTTKTGSISFSKAGWYPLAIVGINMNGTGLSGIQIYRLRITSRASGSVTIDYGVRNRFSASWTGGSLGAYVLWVKE